MKLRTVFLVFLGLLLVCLAGIELAAPGTLPLYTTSQTATAIGVGVIVYALIVYTARLRTSHETVDTPDPEYPPQAMVPGEDLDETLEQFPGAERIYRTPAVTTREGLRRAAISVLTRFQELSVEEATRQVDTGEWTDDRVAAQYLSDGGLDSLPLSLRVRRFVSDDAGQSTVVERTGDAILEAAETEAGVASALGDDRETDATGPQGRPPDGSEGDRGNSEDSEWPEKPDQVAAPTVERTPERGKIETGIAKTTQYWAGVGTLAGVCLGLGLIYELQAVTLAGIVGFGFTAYARLSTLPDPSLAVERTIEPADPGPDEEIEVTVTVTNESESFLPDLRLVDGVPAALSVEEGSPRHGTAVRPGESAEFEYTLTTKRGTHEFGSLLAVARNLSGTAEQRLYVEASTELTCQPQPAPTTQPVPLRAQTAQYTGPVDTEIGGEGIEFHTVRQYEPGDAVSRIDWNRRARTGELSTIEFREQRAANIVLAVDARPDANVAADPFERHALDRAVEAAGRTFERLLADGHQVGIAALGDSECWLAPGAGDSHRIRGRELLATHPAFASAPGEDVEGSWRWEQRLRERLPAGAQLIVFTPLADPVTIVSPDPSSDERFSHELEAVRRGITIADLRRSGVPVVDWQQGESFDHELAVHLDR